MLNLINKVAIKGKKLSEEVNCQVFLEDDIFVIKFWSSNSDKFDSEAVVHVYHGLAVGKYDDVCDVIMRSNDYDNIRAHMSDLLGEIVDGFDGENTAAITRWAADIVFEVARASK